MGKEGELISISEDQRTMTIDPRNMDIGSLQEVLEYQVFTPERTRIIYTYNNPPCTDEITPEQLQGAAYDWYTDGTTDFIEEKAMDLSWASKIVIERLDGDGDINPETS
jgi:hypothetical protein